MQFMVTAYDGKDEGALERRLAVRDKHIALVSEMMKEKKHLYGAALLDEKDRMIGSVLIVDFSNREELESWLSIEPYVVGKVWEQIEVKPCRVAPMFMELHK